MRGAGPIGYPGSAEVVNMRPPAYLITEGINALPCIGDGRQSGTSGSPAAGGYAHPPSQTPCQEIQRRLVGQLDGGGILEGSEQFQRIAQQKGLPRDNH